MPVSVVVGGQYGSEGKGKVALDLVRRDPSISLVVRTGGTNSGHTAYRKDGTKLVLRQLPAACVDKTVRAVFPAGAYIDLALLDREIAAVGLDRSQVLIDPRAQLITAEHIDWERDSRLIDRISSTGSGTGAAVMARLARSASGVPAAVSASEVPSLQHYLADVPEIFEQALSLGERILIEGTQGFGLSPLHGPSWPNCTSRDTTAASFVSEAGLSPRYVDEIVLVLRTFPIRVAGDSGPLFGETTWAEIAHHSGGPVEAEMTSVTQRVRRVGIFDSKIVKSAIFANAPTTIVLNHIDYIDRKVLETSSLSRKCHDFLTRVENDIGERIDRVGTGPRSFFDLHERETARYG